MPDASARIPAGSESNSAPAPLARKALRKSRRSNMLSLLPLPLVRGGATVALNPNPNPLPKGTTYLTHLIKLIAYCAKGAGCNSPAQRAGWAKQGQLSAESAQCDHLCANFELDESGSLNLHRPRFQRS